MNAETWKGYLMHTLVLLRHGESTWNRENLFTGWTDVDLSEKGSQEAIDAGRTLREKRFVFDIAYTSFLKRAIRTLWIVLHEMDLMWIPVVKDWRLNERHYGALQGLDKAQVAQRHGEEQVHIWRRSYDIRPPAISEEDERHPRWDRRYAGLKREDLPSTECLKDTVDRFLPYWQETIVPNIKAGRKIIISAHGNSLRALVKHLDGIGDNEITGLNIPTGIPLVYELDGELRPLKSYYLGDEETIKKAVNAVEDQGKKKEKG